MSQVNELRGLAAAMETRIDEICFGCCGAELMKGLSHLSATLGMLKEGRVPAGGAPIFANVAGLLKPEELSVYTEACRLAERLYPLVVESNQPTLEDLRHDILLMSNLMEKMMYCGGPESAKFYIEAISARKTVTSGSGQVLLDPR